MDRVDSLVVQIKEITRDRVDSLVVLIKEITRDHPLSETEVSALACYADILGFSDAGHAYMEYCVVCDWLECTSRISPKERKDLIALCTATFKAVTKTDNSKGGTNK